MAFSLSEKSKTNRAGIDKRLIEISDLAITITLVDFGHGPYSGLRTAEEQHQLHIDGSSPYCDGYKVKSNHQTGKALDFYAFVDGKASWKSEHLAMVAAAHLQAASTLGYKAKWGGLWPRKNNPSEGIHYGWDCPHIELVD
jgi:peptidoglycan L-alanyl-D-glutamate endopeptidase CwlK